MRDGLDWGWPLRRRKLLVCACCCRQIHTVIFCGLHLGTCLPWVLVCPELLPEALMEPVSCLTSGGGRGR